MIILGILCRSEADLEFII